MPSITLQVGFVPSLAITFEISGGLVAVHCTHGINRTGYLICRYLMDSLNWNAEDAIRGELTINIISTSVNFDMH